MKRSTVNKRESGALMIEVIITIVIIVIGLLGLLEMQSRLQKSEVESYQRSQALLLLNDMVSRIEANRAFAQRYDTGTGYVGVGASCADPASISLPSFTDPNDVGEYVKDVDLAEWCLALQGASEESAAGSSIGAMIGGRGCIKAVPPNYFVSVVWQGLTPISVPPSTEITCAAGLYNLPAGSECAETGNADKCRRFVATQVRIADLSP